MMGDVTVNEFCVRKAVTLDRSGFITVVENDRHRQQVDEVFRYIRSKSTRFEQRRSKF